MEDTRGRRGSTLDETENNNWKRKEKSTKKGRMGGGVNYRATRSNAVSAAVAGECEESEQAINTNAAP